MTTTLLHIHDYLTNHADFLILALFVLIYLMGTFWVDDLYKYLTTPRGRTSRDRLRTTLTTVVRLP